MYLFKMFPCHRELQDPHIVTMNSSSYNFNVTSHRDSQGTAVTKNVFLLTLGLTINSINCSLIHTFRRHQVRILLNVFYYYYYYYHDHWYDQGFQVERETNRRVPLTSVSSPLFQIFDLNPRYILFIHLVLKEMIQLTATISLFLFSYVFYKIQAPLCCLIISLAIFTSLNTPLSLAAMAVECYIAVCLPLRHAELRPIRRTYILIGWIWAMNIVSALSDVFIVLATSRSCTYFILLLFVRGTTCSDTRSV